MRYVVCQTIIFQIWTDKIPMRIVCKRLVPHELTKRVPYGLTEQHMMKQMAVSLKFLTLYKDKGDFRKTIFSLAMRNGSTIGHHPQNISQCNGKWKRKRHLKFKEIPFVGKVIVTALWDQWGTFMADYGSRGDIVNFASYLDTLKRLWTTIKIK